MPDLITCPRCALSFEPTAALREQIERDLRRSLAEDTQRQVARAADAARAEAAGRLDEKDGELRALGQKLEEAARQQAEAVRRQRELEERQRVADLERERQVAAEVARARAQAETEAKARADAQVKERTAAIEQALADANARNAEALRKEAEFLRREREFAEQKAQAEVELQKRLNAESARIREQSARDAAEQAREREEQQRLRDEEHREKEEALARQIADLQQRLQQGSMQTQGEAQEVVLKDRLAAAFPLDTIEDVPKGLEGADLVHRVRDAAALPCGTLLWESKRTKAWSDDWLAKLSRDRAEARADVAVIVSQALPDGIADFGERDGIWICSWPLAVALAAVLRSTMADLAKARRAAEGRGEKIDRLYAYLTGPDFRNRMLSTLESVAALRADFEDEKRAIQRLWAKRDKQLDRAHEGLARFMGDVQGIGALPAEAIPTVGLELPAGTAELEDAPESPETPAPAAPADPDLARILLDLLPPAGEMAANSTVREAFVAAAKEQLGREVGEAEYAATKEALVAEGRAKKGKGRGGSLGRS